MSKLYELAEDFETLYAALDELDPADENYEDMSDAWFDTLEGIEGEFTAKAENIAVFIKRSTSLCPVIRIPANDRPAASVSRPALGRRPCACVQLYIRS